LMIWDDCKQYQNQHRQRPSSRPAASHK
jgi:hypothetical protein